MGFRAQRRESNVRLPPPPPGALSCPASLSGSFSQTLTLPSPSQDLALDFGPLVCGVLSDVGYVLLFLWPAVFESYIMRRFRCGEWMADLVSGGILAITFLAQWHPIIKPKRVDIRPGFEPGY